jgi:hypothetical protein
LFSTPVISSRLPARKPMWSSRVFLVWKEPSILARCGSADPEGLSAWFLRATIRAFAVELNWADSSSPFFLLDRVFLVFRVPLQAPLPKGLKRSR